MNAEQQNKELLKAIQSGAYKGCYLIYNRKSTDEPDNQKNSIKYQKAENGKYAQREKIRLAPISLEGFCADGIISERHSGFKEDNEISVTKEGLVQFRIERPKFQRLVRFLSTSLFKGVVVLCWDRISRNKGDDTVIRKLMRKGIDVRFVFANYDKTSSGALHMDIDGMFAEHHSRVTAEKVTKATWNLRERGICTYRAPIGYLNTGNMEHKPLDPARAPIIKRMFERYASGDWSLEDMARYANEQGLTTVPMRRRRTKTEMLAEEDEEIRIEPTSRAITANMVHKILTNPFYTGKTLGNSGKHVPSNSHVALVPQRLFEDVQGVLDKKKTSVHYTEKLSLHHRGMVRCAICRRVYTPYEQKGVQYFSSRCAAGCSNPKKNLKITFLEEKIAECIARLRFTPQELTEIRHRAGTDLLVVEKQSVKALEESERRTSKVRGDLEYLRANRLTFLKTGVYTPEGYLDEENKLSSEIISLAANEHISGATMQALVKDIVELSELLKSVSGYYTFANSWGREQIARTIFSELSLSQDTLQYKVKKGYRAFESRLIAMGDPKAWLSEALQNSIYVNNCIDDLTRILVPATAGGP